MVVITYSDDVYHRIGYPVLCYGEVEIVR